jgi:hypothetical protein
MRSRSGSSTFTDFNGGNDGVPLFTTFLVLDKTPANSPESQQASQFPRNERRRLREQTLELTGGTVSGKQSQGAGHHIRWEEYGNEPSSCANSWHMEL